MRPPTAIFRGLRGRPGCLTTPCPRTITAGDTALYQALTGFGNPLHCSEPFAQRLGYLRMPVDDPRFHIAFARPSRTSPGNAVANLATRSAVSPAPVYLGTRWRRVPKSLASGTATATGKTGVVHVRSTAVFNQQGELKLTWVRWVMVHRRNAVAAGDHAVWRRITTARQPLPSVMN